MKTIKTIIFALLIILASSCTKDEETAKTGTPTSTTAGFTWRENDPNSTTIQTAFTPTFSTQYKTMFAKTQAGATLFEVNLSGTATGSYTIDNSSNVMTYTGVNPWFIATSGTVVITSNANGKVSGTFEAFRAGAAGTITRIYATFKDITVVP